MSPVLIGVLGIVVVLFLMACGMPIGFAMMLLGFVGFAYLVTIPAAINVMATVPYEVISKYDTLTLPLFLLMGSIFFAAGLGQSLYKMAYAWLGRLPGGLAIATISACAVFAAICSSSIATAVTVGVIALPEMKKYQYDDALATGCVAAGGTLGILIPPSACLIIYGIITQQSIAKLFAAGIMPGILMALMFMGVILIQVRMKPAMAPPGPSSTFKEKMSALGGSAEVLLLIILVLGGLFVGLFTPTEAGGVGAFGAIVLSLIRKRLNKKTFRQAIIDTLRDTGMLFTIMIGAFVLNSFLAASTMPMELAGWIENLNLSPVLIIGVIVVAYLILGCFINSLAMILLTIPVFYPLIVNLGFDPIWFGIMVVICNEMAMITPPVGINVYVISGVAKGVPMHKVFKGIFPFFYVMLFMTILMIAFPQIALFLVQYM